ncbi:MAG: pitrilysin family protein [Bacteroidota bacterium]
MPVVAVGDTEAPLLRVEMIWNAGTPFQPKRTLASVTNELMTEGTRKRSASSLETFFEQYGTTLVSPDVMDTNNLALATIHRHAPAVLPMMAEVMMEPAFSEASFQRILRRRRQRLRENLSDNDTLAYRLITESVFGSRHPYGYNSFLADYEDLNREDIINFHRSHYHAGNGTLLVIGQINDRIERLLEATFGQLPGGPVGKPLTIPDLPTPPKIRQLLRPRAQQTMIRQGRAGIHIDHPDYPGLVILETVYGGYFGSRLMRNIREEKGYTYGIESDLDTYRFDGSFGVAADVANENLANVRREIRLETQKLLQDPVPVAELDMVRAYLGGSIAMELDGVFGHSYRYRSAIIKQYDPNKLLQQLDDAINFISPQELQDLAQRYLSPEADWEVIVGGGEIVVGAEAVERVDQPLVV